MVSPGPRGSQEHRSVSAKTWKSPKAIKDEFKRHKMCFFSGQVKGSSTVSELEVLLFQAKLNWAGCGFKRKSAVHFVRRFFVSDHLELP